MKNHLKNETCLFWGIRHNGKLVGFISIMPETPICGLFYAMHADYRTKGLMTECTMAVIDYIKNNLTQLKKIDTEVYKDNIPSTKLLETDGFAIYKEDESKMFMTLKL